MRSLLHEVVRISLSRRLIKHNQIDMMSGCLDIPLSSIQVLKNRGGESIKEGEAEEAAHETRAKQDEIIRQTELQSQQLIRHAGEQAETIKRKAKETGYQAGLQEGKQSGYQAGYDEALQHTKDMREQAKALLEAAHRESREYIKKTSLEIIQLAAAIAKKIICFSIDVKDESIVEMAKEALRQSEEKRQILMRSPAQFVSILQANAYQFEKICPNATFVFLEDPTIKSPGCVIETDDQVINLEVDKQLDHIIKALQTLEKP